MKMRAFTLIELLVVIAIIAVLMAILMPSLRLAREQARSIQCASNLKTLALAWNMYNDANDDKIVNAIPMTMSGYQSLAPQYDDRPWVLLPGSSVAEAKTLGQEEKKEYIKLGALWPYVKDVGVYRCASDVRGKYPDPAGNAYRSYSMPGGMNGVNPNGGGWEIRACRNTADIKRPADRIVFLPEADTRGVNDGSWVINPSTKQWVDPLAIWHRGNSTNFAFADGHSDKRSWGSTGFVQWCTLSLDEPGKFSFYRSPSLGGDEELDDFRYILKAYAYKSLL